MAVGILKGSLILIFRALRVRSHISVKSGQFALVVRPLDSDIAVLSQVFGWEEYKIDGKRLNRLRMTAIQWKREAAVPVIVDAGANVGYSSLYFHNLFPEAKILAVEPNPETFVMLVCNTSAYPNIIPVNAALWSHADGLSLIARSETSWGCHVAEGKGTPSVRLDMLIASIPHSRVLIVKMDIEGAEKEVISSCPEIFSNAKCILIEPHDYDHPGLACLSPLYRSLAGRNVDTVLSGENLAFFSADL